MKKLIFSALLLPFLMWSAAAAELYRYLPEKPVAIFEFANNGVADSPLVAKIRAAFPELDETMKKLPEQCTSYIRQCCGAVYTNGSFVMVLAGDQLTEENTARHYEEFLAELQKRNDKTELILSRETVNGRTVYHYAQRGQKVVFVHIAPGVAMVAPEEFWKEAEQSAKCNDADFADFRAKIQPTTLFAFQTTDLLRKMLPASQGGAQNPAADLQSISVFCDLNPDHVSLKGDIGLSSAESVKEAQMQVSQAMMIFIGIGLGQDPDLSGDVMKSIRISAKDKTLQIRTKFTDALLIRLGKYLQQSIEEKKARNAAKAAAAGDPAAPVAVPAQK